MAEIKIHSDSSQHDASVSSDASTSQEQSSESRRQAWESGHIDYLGSDSYENIEKNLDSKLN